MHAATNREEWSCMHAHWMIAHWINLTVQWLLTACMELLMVAHYMHGINSVHAAANREKKMNLHESIDVFGGKSVTHISWRKWRLSRDLLGEVNFLNMQVVD